MSNEIQKTNNKPATIKDLMGNKSIQQRFSELLGKKAQGFITSVLQVVNQNRMLAGSDPQTVITAAATAATLDLPVNPNLGFAYIIPYNISEKTASGWQKRTVAQFQMGYKGFIQLAQRTGQYAAINAIPVYENQFTGFNYLTEDLSGDFSLPPSGKVVGYAAYFRLINGFSKTVYWPVEKVRQHAQTYSKSFGKKSTPWKDLFDDMAIKTVLKNALSKYGPLSIDLQTSILADQSVQTEEGEFEYVDNDQPGAIDLEGTDNTKERQRVIEHITGSADLDDLSMVDGMAQELGLKDMYNEKFEQLKNKSNGKDKK